MIKVDFDGARVKVVTELTPWPVSKPIRRASVNSFGYGGANAHCILEGIDSIVPGYKSYGHDISSPSEMISYPTVPSNAFTFGSNKDNYEHNTECEDSSGSQTPSSCFSISDMNREKAVARGLVLLPFSGHDENALKANISATAAVADNFNILDLAYTLGARRSKFFQRAFVIADSDSPAKFLDESRMTFGKTAGSQAQNVGFVFTGMSFKLDVSSIGNSQLTLLGAGQGAQWAGMGSELFAEFEQYRRSIRSMDAILRKLPDPPSWTIECKSLAEYF